MKTNMLMTVASLAAMTPALALGAIRGDLPDETHAWAVHDPNRPRPPVVTIGEGGVPSDAIVLLDGTEATYRANWKSAKKDGGPAPWKVQGDEIVSCDGSILSVREFGDCRCTSSGAHQMMRTRSTAIRAST